MLGTKQDRQTRRYVGHAPAIYWMEGRDHEEKKSMYIFLVQFSVSSLSYHLSITFFALQNFKFRPETGFPCILFHFSLS